jgi:hypothetical protein
MASRAGLFDAEFEKKAIFDPEANNKGIFDQDFSMTAVVSGSGGGPLIEGGPLRRSALLRGGRLIT